MFSIKYTIMFKVQIHVHAGARKSLHVCAYVQEIIHLLKPVNLLPIHDPFLRRIAN